jgi:hypothetical protein
MNIIKANCYFDMSLYLSNVICPQYSIHLYLFFDLFKFFYLIDNDKNWIEIILL